MARTEKIRVMAVMLFTLFIVMTMTSCDKGRDAYDAVSEPGILKMRNLGEVYEAEFVQVVSSTNRDPLVAGRAVDKLCREVCELPKEEAVSILDKFINLTMAAQPPAVTNSASKHSWPAYNARSAWFEKMFFMFGTVFPASLRLRNGSFEYWDVLFRFLGRYTDEISEVEKSLSTTGRGVMQQSDKRHYLLCFKGNLGTWIHITRRSVERRLGEGLTEEQKADVMRRLDEVAKFAVLSSE